MRCSFTVFGHTLSIFSLLLFLFSPSFISHQPYCTQYVTKYYILILNFFYICSPLFFFLFIFQKSCKNCSLRIGLLTYLSTIVMAVPFRKMEDGVEEEEGLPVYLYSGQYWPAKSSSWWWWWWWRSCRQCCGSI